MRVSTFDLVTVRMGLTLCDVSEELNPAVNSGASVVMCTTPPTEASRRNDVTVTSSGAFGYAAAPASLTTVSPYDGKAYMYTQHPRILSLSASVSGTRGGLVLNISGIGFASNASSNMVSIDGAACTVLSSSVSSISCVLGGGQQPVVDVVRRYGGGRGMLWEVRRRVVVVVVVVPLLC